jgi:hypothetical protein
MEITDLLKSVRFVMGQDGKPTDAVLSIEDWERLIEWLEDLEDTQIVHEGLARLKRADGDPSTAGLKKWSEVETELEALDQTEETPHA